MKDQAVRITLGRNEVRIHIPFEMVIEQLRPRMTKLRDGSIAPMFTRREKEVFELIRRCLVNKEIARRLHISERGIKFHASNILHKTGLTRAQLINKFGIVAEGETHGNGTGSGSCEVVQS